MGVTSPTYLETSTFRSQKTSRIAAGAGTALFLILLWHIFLPPNLYGPSQPEATLPSSRIEVQKQQPQQNQRQQQRDSPAHIYIVGCGHSGTSFFLRTISNLPGVMCVPMETNLFLTESKQFIHYTASSPLNATEIARVKATSQEWDTEAKAGKFSAWVEKTPKHVNHISRIFSIDPTAKVLFLVRDGRDVALSFQKRGFEFQLGLERWVADNMAALPYLDDERVLLVKFEELSSFDHVAEVMQSIDAFVSPATGIESTVPRLLMSLLPPAVPYGSYAQLCKKYNNDTEKFDDLALSHLKLMHGELKERAVDMPDNEDHRKYRRWQMLQPWFVAEPVWPKEFTSEQRKMFEKNANATKLLKLFDYPKTSSL